jgi:hypothetical protein
MSIYKYEEITGQIIDAAYTVHNKLGYGFLEKVYHNSLGGDRVKEKKPPCGAGKACRSKL